MNSSWTQLVLSITTYHRHLYSQCAKLAFYFYYTKGTIDIRTPFWLLHAYWFLFESLLGIWLIYDIFFKRYSSCVVCIAYLNSLRPRRNRRNVADDIFKSIFLNEMNKFRQGFYWSLFLRFELKIFQHWFRLWLGADQATSHYLNQSWLVYWRIYALLGLNELILACVE